MRGKPVRPHDVAILEEAAATADGPAPGALPAWESEAILIGAPDRATWVELAGALRDWLERRVNLSVSLKDLAYTLNTDQPPYPFRVGLVVTSTADLRDRLRGLVSRVAGPSCRSIQDARGTYFWEEPLGGPGALAFLYPGEGSQYPGMLADLGAHFPEVRAQFDTADRVALEQGHARLPSDVLFGGDEEEGGLWSMQTAVSVVLSAQWALHQLLAQLGLRPDAVLGHSSGEFLALASAGALQVDRAFEDGLGRLGTIFEGLEGSGRLPAAALMAVAADRARVESACRAVDGSLVVAMDNCPHQVVVAGPPSAVARLSDRLRGEGILSEPLPFARAYHTREFAAALEPIRAFFDGLSLEQPRIPIYSCAVAGRMGRDKDTIRRLAVEQWAMPVAFRSTIEAMHAEGVRVFVEVGARGNLTGFVADTLRGRPHFAVAANLPRRSGLTQLNHLTAALFAQGVALRPGLLYARRRPSRIDFDADLLEPRLAPGLAAALQPEHNGAADGNGNDNGPQDDFAWPLEIPELREALAPTSSFGARAQAMMDHLRTMDAFLNTQKQVLDAYLMRGTEAERGDGPAPAREPGPWVGVIESLDPGRELVSLRRIDATNDPVAEHHTLGGRRVSALDPARKGLPVLPFTVMAEMLAQAAAVLVPDAVIVALRDVHAHKWVRYEETPFDLELRARRAPERPDTVRVEIVNKAAGRGRRPVVEGPVFEGTVVFGPSRPPGPFAPPFALDAARACRFTAEELYEDQWLFHGPALRALVRVGLSSPGGIEGVLRVLPLRGLLRDGERLDLKTDPIVLDAFTHLLGCWGLDEYGDGAGDVIFPLRLGELSLFGTDPPEGSEVSCRIAVREVTRHRVRVDADIAGPDGRPWMRLTDWEDWRFYWPGRYRDQFRAPDRVLLGEPLELPGASAAEAERLRAVWLGPPADMSKPVWRDVLEWTQLGTEERARHEARPGPEARRTMRLFGRIAAKEAVRRLWLDRGGTPVYPADLAIEPDARGRPWVRSPAEPERRDLPAVSIAHVEGTAVALAALDPEGRVGIDIERIVDRPPGFEEIAFTDAERQWLAVHPELDRAEWFARFWCAKEAVSKATGFGMLVGPASVVVVDADTNTGALAVALGTDLAHALPEWGKGPVRAVSARRGDHVWAWTSGTRYGQ